MTPEQIEAMVEGLNARLKDNPNDADGWAMLGRSQMVLGRHALAVPALQKAVALRGDDAALLTEYADALAVVNGRNLDGEPSRLLAQALAIEPNNQKALLLSGMHAFQQKDHAKALQQWEKVVQLAPSGELAQQLQGVIAQARERASGGAAASANAATTTAAAPGTSVSGTVTLAPALAAKAKPDDTVFVFARAAEGPRMPLAILAQAGQGPAALVHARRQHGHVAGGQAVGRAAPRRRCAHQRQRPGDTAGRRSARLLGAGGAGRGRLGDPDHRRRRHALSAHAIRTPSARGR